MFGLGSLNSISSTHAYIGSFGCLQTQAVNEQFGVEMSSEYTEDLKNMYHHYFQSLFPPVDVPLGYVLRLAKRVYSKTVG